MDKLKLEEFGTNILGQNKSTRTLSCWLNVLKIGDLGGEMTVHERELGEDTERRSQSRRRQKDKEELEVIPKINNLLNSYARHCK